jgi:hypothetical protein
MKSKSGRVQARHLPGVSLAALFREGSRGLDINLYSLSQFVSGTRNDAIAFLQWAKYFHRIALTRCRI